MPGSCTRRGRDAGDAGDAAARAAYHLLQGARRRVIGARSPRKTPHKSSGEHGLPARGPAARAEVPVPTSPGFEQRRARSNGPPRRADARQLEIGKHAPGLLRRRPRPLCRRRHLGVGPRLLERHLDPFARSAGPSAPPSLDKATRAASQPWTAAAASRHTRSRSGRATSAYSPS